MLLFALAGSVTSLAQALEQCCKSGRLYCTWQVPLVLLKGVNSDFINAFRLYLHQHSAPALTRQKFQATTYAFL